MSTAAVSTVWIFQELHNFYQNRQSDLKQLGSALQSADLNGAQQAYSALAVLGEYGPFANSEPFGKSSRAQAFNALGEALQAGDLARAQTSFATLTGSQHQSAAASQTPPAAVMNLTSPQPSSATPTESASSIYKQWQSYRQQRQADIAKLGQDLQAGDPNAAQQDFDTLTALGQSGPYKSGQAFQRPDRAQDFNAMGQALQSGDLAGAQSAFASLAGTFGHHNHHAGSAISAYHSDSGTAEIIINLGGASSTSASSGSTPEVVIKLGQGSGPSSASQEEVTINLGQGSSSSSASHEEVTINLGNGSTAAQISIDATQGQNGSSDQVTINLKQQNKYELILNLLNSTPATQTPTGSSNALSVQA